MKRIALLLTLLSIFALQSFAQTTVVAIPNIYRTFKLTAASPVGPAATPWIAEIGTGVKSHAITWTTSGTVSTCSVKVQKSEDGTSWSDLIAGATCTSNSSTGTITTDVANYVRVNATTLTGSGTLNVTYVGYVAGLPLSATISGDVTSATGTNFHVVVDSGGGGGSTAQGADTAGVTGSLTLVSTTTSAPTYTTAKVNPLSGQTDGGLRVGPSTPSQFGIYIEDAAETAGANLVMAGSVRRDTAASSAGTTGDNATFNTDSRGALWITPADVDCATSTTVCSPPVPIGGVYYSSPTALTDGQVGYPLLSTAHRLSVDVNTLPTLALVTTVSTVTAVTAITNALPAGTNNIGFVTPTPGTTGGWLSINATAADGATACTNSAQAIKASAGTFGGYFYNNPNTADEYIQVYNVAFGSVTVGTTNPQLTFHLPGAASNSVAANLEIGNGLNFATAMSFACTTTAGGNGAPSTALDIDFWYK